MRKLFLAGNSQNYISMASIWEIGIKASLEKLKLEGGIANLLRHIEDMGIEVTHIESSHLEIIESLPFHHKDPFDRLIAATAMKEKMVLLSGDRIFEQYDVQLEKN